LRNVLGGIESEKTGFKLKCRFKWLHEISYVFAIELEVFEFKMMYYFSVLIHILLEHILLGQNLDFPICLKLEIVSFLVFQILSENELLWTKKMTWLVYSSYGLRRSMWSWYNVLTMKNLVFGKNGGILDLRISHTDLGQTWN